MGASAVTAASPVSAVELSEKVVVFVGGLHKSGTSAVARCLAAHPDVSGFASTGVPRDEGQHLQTVYRPAREHGGPGRFAFDTEAHLTERSPLANASSRARLLAEWGPRWNLSKRVLLEKSPPNLIRTRFLQALFPEAVFVLVMRHPLAVALATQKWVEDPIERLLAHWFCAHRLLAADLPFARRAILLRYEDLIANPSPSLASLEALIGVRGLGAGVFEPGRDAALISSWTPSAQARRTVLARFEATANLFGYSLRSPGIA